MPIRFTCPYCEQQTLVEERFVGLEGPCVNCGRTVVVPADAPRVAEPAAESAAEASTRRWMRISLYSIAGVALVASLVGLAALVLQPAIASVKAAGLRRRCAGNLAQLALAIDAYEQNYGSYPPAFTLGSDGKPWHSWRVLILPYLGPEASQVYSQYDLSQPWDSPHNRRVIGSMPSVFASPADPSAETKHETSYFAVVGPGMAFSGADASSTKITDGLDQTILLVEAQDAGIVWTQPRDLDGLTLTYMIGVDLGGHHPGGMNVVTADAQTHFLPDSLTPQEVRALLTASGGENASLAGD